MKSSNKENTESTSTNHSYISAALLLFFSVSRARTPALFSDDELDRDKLSKASKKRNCLVLMLILMECVENEENVVGRKDDERKRFSELLS